MENDLHGVLLINVNPPLAPNNHTVVGLTGSAKEPKIRLRYEITCIVIATALPAGLALISGKLQLPHIFLE